MNEKKTRGRPPSELRSKSYIRSFEEERIAWIKAAEREGLDLATWIRYHLNQAAKKSS